MGRTAAKIKPSSNKVHSLVREFIDTYKDSLPAAERAAAMTCTEKWQEMYGERRKEDIRARASIATRFRNHADLLEKQGWDEDDEKEVKALLKEATEHLKDEQTWNKQTLSRVLNPIRRLKDIHKDYQQRAQNMAVQQPMFAQQLGEQLEEAYKGLPHAEFNKETGVITIE